MMKQEDLFKKLGLILNELNEQYEFLAQNPQQLNDLELALFHANANFLADHVEIIKKLSSNQQQPLALSTAEEEINLPENRLDLEDNNQKESQIEEIAFVNLPDEEPIVIEEDQDLFEIAPVSEVVNEQPVIAEKREDPLIHFQEIEEEVFKLDNEPSTFEFILNDHSEHETLDELPQIENDQLVRDSFVNNENKLDTKEKFDFEEKSVDEIFNRPLSEEEQDILAEKAKLRAQHLAEVQDLVDSDEDEIGPEPFLVQQEEEEFSIEKEDLALEVAPIEKVTINQTDPVEDPTYKQTLNDLLAKSNSVNVNSISGTAITDLKQAINLNDKLLYIKDLFNGYNLAYAEAIDLANKLPNFEAADQFFKNNYAVKNNWSEKQNTVDKFYQLLNQRFKTPNP